MSILLDALKKSEAQRQIGRTPGLTTPMEPARAGNEDLRIWLPAGMIALAALALAWFGWAQFAAPAASPPAAAIVAEPERAQETVRAAEPAPARQRKAGGSRTPVDRYTKPAAETSAPADTAASQSLREKQLLAAGVRARPGAAEGDARAEPAQPERISSPEAAPGATTANPPERVSPSDSSKDPAQSSFEPDTISYWQIPASLRSEMPELRISVLVYAEQAQDRFLLVNGQRLREGQEIDGGVVLEQIRRDRAVFTFRNYRFHLKN